MLSFLQPRKKRIRVYSLSTCPSCRLVKEFLDRNNAEYECIEIDKLDSGEQWLASKEVKIFNPQNTYPTIVIEDIIVGFDEDALKAVIGIK
jgi:glutaredoxin-like protein NrdH